MFVIIYAVGNFLGPLTLGRLFDTVGRKPMIVGTYVGSAVVVAVLGVLFSGGSLSAWALEAFIVGAFFLASAGASAAYLTVSEIFPMETRALAIAFFYAVGTAAGGIVGPLLFGHLIGSGVRSQVAIAFYIGAAVMALGGLAELMFGVKAEQRSLEDIATPLTAADAEDAPTERAAPADARAQRRQGWEGRGLRRFRPGPGPGQGFYSPGMVGTSGATRAATDTDSDREVEAIARALDEHGAVDRRELGRLVGARYWGPGRFSSALRQAVIEGRARQLARGRVRPCECGERSGGAVTAATARFTFPTVVTLAPESSPAVAAPAVLRARSRCRR